MKTAITFLIAALLTATMFAEEKSARFGLVIHGGAGTIEKATMTAELEQAYRKSLEGAFKAGEAILAKGGTSLDAAETVVRMLEDDELFNAGRGAVFTNAGTNELDASIMEGHTLRAGAVAAVARIKNPISLARMVMEQSPHVMLVGEGAETFAQSKGVELVDPKYFSTETRRKELEDQRRKDPDAPKKTGPSDQRGTVGAVALDHAGHLAAATSTGGVTNKRWGRVGDSPIIGAGTYANGACAISATGDGEYFIRTAAARSIAALHEYRGMSIKDAAQAVIDEIGRLGGGGGMIAIDRRGKIALPFNTPGMYRAYIGADGKHVIEIYR